MTPETITLLVLLAAAVISALYLVDLSIKAENKARSLKIDKRFFANKARELRQENAILERDNDSMSRKVRDAEADLETSKKNEAILGARIEGWKQLADITERQGRMIKALSDHTVYIRTARPKRKWIRQTELGNMTIIFEHDKTEF